MTGPYAELDERELRALNIDPARLNTLRGAQQQSIH